MMSLLNWPLRFDLFKLLEARWLKHVSTEMYPLWPKSSFALAWACHTHYLVREFGLQAETRFLHENLPWLHYYLVSNERL